MLKRVSPPDVAVCIAAYNAEATVERAVRSALREPEVSEVIVVDDASQDATARRAEAADDGSGRLRIIAMPRNGGPAAARNAAIEHSTAEAFAIFDSDDFFLPGRFQTLLDAGGDDWDLLADNIMILSEQLVDRDPSPKRAYPAAAWLDLNLAAFVNGNLTKPNRPRSELGFLKPIRRSFLDRHALRYDPKLRLGEDYAFYVDALLAGARFRVVRGCGYVAVERAQSLSSVHRTTDLEALAAAGKRQLESAARLTREECKAMAAHHRLTANKALHRRVLDCRQAHGIFAALQMMARGPTSIPYILGETLRAKFPRLLWPNPRVTWTSPLGIRSAS